MSLSPQILLSSVARERCISKLKELPLMYNKQKKCKPASVLVPICIDNGEVCLLYTLRSSNLKQHSGQVSFPGGKADKDESMVETALRETEEEIGVPHTSIEVWAEMPQVQGRNKEICITPVVGFINNFDMSKLTPSVDEVEEVFRVSMKEFCNKKNHGHVNYENYKIPVFMTKHHKVWGITGLITHLFLQSFLPENIYQLDLMNKEYSMKELMASNSKL
jgi:nudix motif 8